jgi:hypothetical protein
VYVYCIIANLDMGNLITTTTNLSVSLDGVITNPPFVHAPDSTEPSDFLYNVPVYSKAALENTNHTLVISTNAQQNSSLILFDYATYTCVHISRLGKPAED